MPRKYTSTPPEIRFWAKVNKNGPIANPKLDRCWIWTGAKNDDGYGAFTPIIPRPQLRAHRYAYELTIGPIPSGLTLDHLCFVRHCVRPSHLEPATSRANILRGQGRAAVNARKTHCIRGHELSGGNLIFNSKTSSRHCRICKVAGDKRRKELKHSPA